MLSLALLSSAASAQETPIQLFASSYAAGLGYVNHSYREGGIAAQIRLDAWQGLRWSVHAAYTPLVIIETNSTGGQTTENFHDFQLGGTWTPSLDLPIWIWIEGHGLAGDTSYGTGGGFLAGFGARWLDMHLEVGAGGLWLSGDQGTNVSARLGYAITPWLDISALGLFTENHPGDSSLGSGGNHWAYGADAKLGPFGKTTIELRWMGGDRVLALDRLGTTVENLPDTMHDNWSASVSFPVHGELALTLGASVQRATETSGNNYLLTSGFFGFGSSF